MKAICPWQIAFFHNKVGGLIQMIYASLAIVILLLFFVSYYLTNRQAGLLFLTGDSPKNKTFFATFGKLYFLLALIGLVVIFLNNSTWTLFYVLLLLFLSATFSIQFSKKISQKKQ